MSALGYELARDLIADEIADAGAACIARVARTADTPAAWRMVARDLARWTCRGVARADLDLLALAAVSMRRAQGGPGAAVALLADATCDTFAAVDLLPGHAYDVSEVSL